MRLFAAFALLVASCGIAPAQTLRSLEGPLLVPPGQSIRSGIVTRTPEGRGYSYGSSRHDAGERYESVQGPVRYRDPRMRQIAVWYRDLLGRDMNAVEEHNWSLHIQDPSGQAAKMMGVLAMILGGEEFYNQTGRRFDRWVAEVAEATGRDISREEAAEWRETHRHAADPVRVRIDLVGHLVAEHPPEPVVVPGGYEAPRPINRPAYEVPWYAESGRHEHGHEHTTAYGPVGQPPAEPELIADWYRTFFGREIAPHELNKWLNDRRKGMPLDEVYASVLGADEWYARTGASPTRWIGATLDALGQSADRNAVGHWYDRYRRHNGDRFKTALEMIRTAGGPHHDHGRDRHDDDD